MTSGHGSNRRFNSSFAAILVAGCALTSGTAECQTPEEPQAGYRELKRLSLEELSQLEITTVSKEPSRAFRTPAAIYVMTQEDIRRSGATSIPDILRLIPGVNVAQIDSGKWAVGVRGFQGRLSRAVRVMIDGRSVYTPLFAGVYWEMHHVMLEDIDRIEVVRGPGGTIWGSNAFNGVINIITKNAKDTRGTLVSVAAGTVEQSQVSVRYGAGDDKLSYRFYGMGFSRAPQYHRDGRDFDDWRMGQFGFRADWNPNDRDSFTFSGDSYGVLSGSKLVLNSFSPPANPAVEDNGLFSGQNLRAVWARRFASGSDMRLETYWDRTDRQDLNYREVRNTIDFDFIHHIPFQRHDVIWGLGARTSPSEFFQTTQTVDFLPHQQTYNVFTGFLQDEIALAPEKFYLTIGTKLERNTFSGFEYQPSARFTWSPTPTHTIWGAVTRAVRTPSRVEEDLRLSSLLVPAIPLYVRLIGDGQFDREQLVGYEAGWRIFAKKAGFLSIGAFHNRYDDLLSVDSQAIFTESDPPPTRLVLPLYLRNGIEATTSGVEIAGLLDISKWWRQRGSYSYLGMDAKRKPTSNDASTVGQLEGDSPAHKAVLQSIFILPRSLELTLTWRYVSAVPNQRVPSYNTGDFRLARHIAEGVEVSVVGQNLFQPYHFEYGGDPGGLVGIRRAAYLRITWTR